MRYAVAFFILLLFFACSKPGSTPPVQTPPRDTTVITPPKKDTTTTPPKDTTTAPPKDTTPSAMVYKTIVSDGNLINELNPGNYYIKYYNSGGTIAQMNSYEATDATLSSHNVGDITISIDANTGSQLLTSSKLTNKTATEVAPVSDTSKFYYLLVTRNDTTTVIFPDKPIVYQNFLTAITASDEQSINNRVVHIEKLIVK